ncbi:MAG: DUF5671 domain-containing protein [Candidatus Paceibacteria bacterium]
MEQTPRNIVLQVGSLIALYLSVSFLLTLIFGLINLAFPIASDNYWEIESAGDSVRLGIAMVIVFFPTYLILTRLVNKYRRSESGLYQNITRWLVYFSLLIGGLVMLVTLVTVIYTFLNGDVTTRFFLKAGAVFAITGIAFYYYLLDLRGYWVKNESKSIMYGSVAGVVVLALLILGFMNIETPAEVREMKVDEQQLNDLRNIQWRIESYLDTSTTTPETLVELYGDMEMIPTAPFGREAYSYEVTNTGFRLCATFSRNASSDNSMSYFDPNLRIKQSENWNYQAGRHCFERAVQ